MKKTISVLFICGVMSTMSFSQEKQQHMKWVWKTSVGYALPVLKFPNGHITDHLIGNSRDRFYGQFASFIFFINENWGIENTIINYNFENSIDKQTDLFRTEIAKHFPDYYLGGDFWSIQSQMLAWRLGPVYKWEQERFIFSVGLPVLGLVDVTSSDLTLRLKRKNSHEVIKLNFSSSKEYSGSQGFYSFNPYFSVGYRLSKRFIFNFDTGINVYKVKFNYTETEHNWLTNNIATKTYPYNKWVADLNFGVGFWVVIGHRK